MPWVLTIEQSPNHWFINFTINAKQHIHTFVYDNSLLLLQPSQEYPPLPTIAIYRVFKDKYGRLHYFTLSSPHIIEQFVEDLQLDDNRISWVTDINVVNHRVLKITLPNKFVYCLPQLNIVPRTRMHA